MKKLLLCILCSTIVTTFIGFTIIFIYQFPIFLINDISMQTDADSELFSESFNEYEKIYQQIVNTINEQKEIYGDDYPAGGRFLHNLMYRFGGNELIVNTYITSLLIGIIFGVFIYLIFIQKITSKHIELKIGLAFIIILTIIPLINLGYTIVYNISINSTDSDIDFITDMYICDLDTNIILGISLGIFFLVLLANLIFQKIKTHKLNKALEESK